MNFLRSKLGALAVAVAILIPSGLALTNQDWLPEFNFGSETHTSTTVPLLLTMKNIADYHAASGTFQTLVEQEIDKTGPRFLTGSRTSLYAVGTVDAVVDFGQITEDSIEVDDERREVTIRLPAPTYTNAAIDQTQSKIVKRDLGLFDSVDHSLNDTAPDDRPVYQEAVGQLNLAARQSDLQVRAVDNTRVMLTGMLNSLGFTEIVIEFEEPVEAKG